MLRWAMRLMILLIAVSGWAVAVVVIYRNAAQQPLPPDPGLFADVEAASDVPRGLRAERQGLNHVLLTWKHPWLGEKVSYNVYRSFYCGVEPKTSKLDQLIATGLTRPSYTDAAPGGIFVLLHRDGSVEDEGVGGFKRGNRADAGFGAGLRAGVGRVVGGEC